jgi:hypothetical protein
VVQPVSFNPSTSVWASAKGFEWLQNPSFFAEANVETLSGFLSRNHQTEKK